MNADGTVAQVHPTFTRMHSGVSMQLNAEVYSILQSGHLAAKDELSVFTLAPLAIKPPFSCDEVVVPATDKDGTGMILKGWLVHLGQQKIGVARRKNVQLALEDTVVVLLQTFKQQWSDLAWESLQKGPAKSILGALAIEVWARSWNSGNKPAKPSASDGFSMMARIREKCAQATLAKSGLTPLPVFVTHCRISPQASK